LQPAEDARDVAHLLELFAQRGDRCRVVDEVADEGLPAGVFGEIERGGGEPAFEQARTGGGDCAVDGVEQ
jgi:hypothetical protein